MSYYNIPKNDVTIRVNIKTNDHIEPILSNSLCFHLGNLKKQTVGMEPERVKKMIDHVNLATSTSNPLIVMELLELHHLFSASLFALPLFMTEGLLKVSGQKEKGGSSSLYISPHHQEITALLKRTKETVSMPFLLPTPTPSSNSSFDLIIIDAIVMEDPAQYIQQMVLAWETIAKCQALHGTCILKIGAIYYKPVLDLIFILSGMYQKVYLAKPTISNATTEEKFLVCINMVSVTPFPTPLSLFHGGVITSLMDNSFPIHILNKLEETNLIIGQQQLDAWNQIIYLLKNKQGEEKLDMIHHQKFSQWAEKCQLSNFL